VVLSVSDLVICDLFLLQPFSKSILETFGGVFVVFVLLPISTKFFNFISLFYMPYDHNTECIFLRILTCFPFTMEADF